MITQRVKIILYVCLSIFILVIALFGLFWAPDKSNVELKHWLLPESQFVEAQGIQVHVAQSSLCKEVPSKALDEGVLKSKTPRPKVIVLLHGTSASLHTWNGWVPQLSDEYCVVRMDLPGFGLTGPFTDKSKTYTSDNYAALVIKVLDKLQVTQATLVGNSLGGKIAWRTAALYPEYVENLILIDSVGYPATPKQVPIAFRLAKYPVMAPILTHVLPRSVVKKSLLSVYADDSKVSDILIDRYYDLALRTGNRQALIQRMREFDNTDDQDQINGLIQPTLILWGAEDDLIPLENARRFHQAIKNSQLKIFDHLGHVPHEEDPDTTVTVAKNFLSGKPLGD